MVNELATILQNRYQNLTVSTRGLTINIRMNDVWILCVYPDRVLVVLPTPKYAGECVTSDDPEYLKILYEIIDSTIKERANASVSDNSATKEVPAFHGRLRES